MERAAVGASFAGATTDHRVDPRASRRHQREFRRYKEGVRRDEHDDRHQAPA